MHDIDIQPGVGIFTIIKSMSYKPQYALAEYIDNSISSYEQNKIELRRINKNYKLRVVIQLSTKQIIIKDNAGGIAKKDYARAFKPAELPPDRKGLNEFGMGMKTASIWLSKKWKVITNALGEHETGVINFDVDEIIRSKKAALSPIFRNKNSPTNHGTEIILDNLNHALNPQVVRRIKEHLAFIYRKYLKTDTLDIVVIGEGDSEVTTSPLKPYEEAPTLIAKTFDRAERQSGEELKWEKVIEIPLSSGRHIAGSAKILSKGDTANAGLYLFRRNRLILSADEPFRPEEIFGRGNSYQSQRLFIELDMKGFEVTHTKDDFIWVEDEKSDVMNKIRDALVGGKLNLIAQAENYRAKKSEKDPKEVQKEIHKNAEILFDELGKSSSKLADINESKPLPQVYLSANSSKPSLTTSKRITISGEEWTFNFSTANGERYSPVFFHSYENLNEAGHKCEIRLNIDNAFTISLLNDDNLWILQRIVIAISYAQAQSKKSNSKDPGYIVTNINRMLTELPSEK